MTMLTYPVHLYFQTVLYLTACKRRSESGILVVLQSYRGEAMAPKTVKIAISLPQHELESLDRLAKQLGLARSALLSEALRMWLKREGQQREIQNYQDSYRKHPETDAEIQQAASLAQPVLNS